ncbi:MAG: transporter suffix domain-containing protein [Myxococcota bacterium]
MSSGAAPGPRRGLLHVLGVGLMLLSFVPWIAMLAVPLLGLSLARSSALVAVLFGTGEGLFWAGAALAGGSLLKGLWRWRPWRRPQRGPEPEAREGGPARPGP